MGQLRIKLRRHGFTLVELLVTIAIIGILASLLLPVLSKGKVQAKRVRCVGQLKDLGIAFHSFAHDHLSLFPIQVSASEGGSREYVQAGNLIGEGFCLSAWQFMVMSNELATPRNLTCPADTRLGVSSFTALRDANLSYLVGLDAEYREPASILLVDRNITIPLAQPSLTQSGVGLMKTAGWSDELHQSRGNVLLADGHVETRKIIQFKPVMWVWSRTGSRGVGWPGSVPPLPAIAAGPGISSLGGETFLGAPKYWSLAGAANPGAARAGTPPYRSAPAAVPVQARQPMTVASAAERKSPTASASIPAPITAAAVPSSGRIGGSPFNYWLLLLLLLVALTLRHLLLKSVSKKGTRRIGQAIPQGRWSRRIGRD